MSAAEHGKPRTVTELVASVQTLEGGGFPVRRPFPTNNRAHCDPFLLLDHMGPVEWAPGTAIGAPDHPHRGFETVTYMLEGRMRHKDSQGNAGLLSPGDVQWMTAGAGVIHSEMPDEEFKASGGVTHGFQLWVNLPRQDKMMKPRYQDIPSERIPEARSGDGQVKVRIIAGEALGHSAVIDTRIPITYLHLSLEAGASFSQPAPASRTTLVYVFRGSGTFGATERTGTLGELMLFGDDGDTVTLRASDDEKLECLLLAGEPINEPIVQYGPFVMNTVGEIKQALLDFQSGRFGEIDF